MENENFCNFIIECPHCFTQIIIEKLNCCIFRHGILKNNGLQIDPHASKDLCDFYINKQLIYGCGKPFQLVPNINSISNDDKYIAVICNYI